MPNSADLVTDLPADFNVFGQGVDTSMSQLLGGTTGQVLSKTSATNMAFTWTTPTDQTPLTTKGDLFTFSTVDARIGVGANNTILTADSSEATGLKWATPAAAASGMTLISRSTFSNVAGTNIDSVFTSTYKTYLVVVESIYGASGADDFYFQWRYSGTTQSANYNGDNAMLDPNSGTWAIRQVSGASQFEISRVIGESTYTQSAQIYCNNVGNSSQNASLIGQGMMAGFYNYGTWFSGMTSDARTYTGFRLSSSSSNITGVVSVYGLATS
jgi:hypothetical protein